MGSKGEKQAAAEVLAKAKAKTARVRLCLDGDLLDEHAQLSAQLEAARKHDELSNDPDTAPAIARQIIDLEEQIAEAEVEFVFRGMGRGRWRKMLADHPPSDEHRAEGADFDPDVFPFEAMAASLVVPTFTADQLRELHEEVLDESGFQMIWAACIKANMGQVNRPESVAARSVLERNERLRSVPPSNSGSAAAS